MKLRVTARGSRLSLIQAGMLIERILASNPRLNIVFKATETTGDRNSDKPFASMGTRGIFEKEVNRAVVENEADVAVHSLKDVPGSIDSRLILAAVLPRDPPYDALVPRREISSLSELPRGAVVGTSSARRKAMMLHYRKDLRIKPVRGNVDTRLRKLMRGEYDALVLAEAGLKRLGVKTRYIRIPPSIVLPAPGQGIIAAYVRRSDQETYRLVSAISHWETMVEARAERAFLKAFGGGCSTPVGSLAELRGGRLTLKAVVLSPEGGRKAEVSLEGDPRHPEALGLKAAEMLREKSRGTL